MLRADGRWDADATCCKPNRGTPATESADLTAVSVGERDGRRKTFCVVAESKLTGCAPECYHSCLFCRGMCKPSGVSLVSRSRLSAAGGSGIPD